MSDRDTSTSGESQPASANSSAKSVVGGNNRIALPSWFWPALAIAAVGSVALDLLIGRHGKFAVLDMPGFYVLFGSLVGLGLVGVALVFGALFKQPDGYYDDQ